MIEFYQRNPKRRHPNLDLAKDVIELYRANRARKATQEKVIHPVTGNQLTVDDGVVWEGGKRQRSTRSMLAALLARGEGK